MDSTSIGNGRLALSDARERLAHAARGLQASVKPWIDNPPTVDVDLDRRDDRVVGSITVHMPDRDVSMTAEAPDPSAAARDLGDQIRTQMALFRVEQDVALRRRMAEREDAAPLPAVHDGRKALSVHVPALRRAARHELEAARLEHDMPIGWLDTDDILDAAIAHVLDHQPDVPSAEALAERVYLAILLTVEEEVSRYAQERARLEALDTSTRELSAGEAMVTLGDELQATAAWPNEPTTDDVLPDPDALDPEALVADREQRRHLVRALFSLPRPTRRTFELVVMDDWSAATAAKMTGLVESTVDDVVVEAARSLTAQLTNGRAPSPDRIVTLYRHLGQTLRSELQAETREALAASPMENR